MARLLPFRLLLLVAVACAPRTALAGALVDAAHRAQSWAPALGPSLTVLVIDAVVFAFASRAAGLVPRIRMRRVLVIGALAALGAALWQDGSVVWGVGAFVVVLAAAFVASVIVESTRRLLWSAARLAGVVVSMLVFGGTPARGEPAASRAAQATSDAPARARQDGADVRTRR